MEYVIKQTLPPLTKHPVSFFSLLDRGNSLCALLSIRVEVAFAVLPQISIHLASLWLGWAEEWKARAPDCMSQIQKGHFLDTNGRECAK